ncbi:MAG: type II toxin-antitoxin system prevent-host-death family antitoxin [Methylacidiphilales bacterium]|nr:type II toxin-antitoxin system prevent-host-death family antitoxin [Candidatus Methylacidiphilales bacterium]
MEVGAYEAKTHLPSLLERVQHGERVTITKHGVPVAMLVPVVPVAKPDLRAVIDELKIFAKGHSTGGMTIREMIVEGRR